MRTKILLFVLAILMISTASAEIVITQTPKDLYNMGDLVEFNVKVTGNSGIDGFFEMNLLCNGRETSVHKEYISLSAGEEKSIETQTPLVREFVGGTSGTCRIKSTINEEESLSKEFEVTDKVNVVLREGKESINPGESYEIEGTATKENTEGVNGFIDIKVIGDDGETEISSTETVSESYFNANFSTNEDIPAGEYTINLNVYETDNNEEKTNKGSAETTFNVNQVPKNLEVDIEEREVNPGEEVEVSAILHDQSGEPMSANAVITIKNENDRTMMQKEVETGERVSHPIKYNQNPAEWEITATSNQLEGFGNLRITENEEVDIDLVNQTMIVTNVGNVPYNETVNIRIGEEIREVQIRLNVDETKQYELTAPNGEYDVEINTVESSGAINERVFLTGNAVSIKEASKSAVGLIKRPIIWLFIIAILAIVAYTLFKRGYKKSFFGYKREGPDKPKASNKEKKKEEKGSLVTKTNKAELSPSIHGDKQDSSILTLKIKNLDEIKKGEGNAKESLQKIVDYAESQKAGTYENGDTIMFVLAPLKTKTFRNEMTSYNIAEKAKKTLDYHNKMFKQRIDYGISLNQGPVVAKEAEGTLKFMIIGNALTNSKKIASLSEKEILLTEPMKEKMASSIKYEKKTLNGINVYEVKEVKNKEKYEKFIKGFVRRMEGKE